MSSSSPQHVADNSCRKMARSRTPCSVLIISETHRGVKTKSHPHAHHDFLTSCPSPLPLIRPQTMLNVRRIAGQKSASTAAFLTELRSLLLMQQQQQLPLLLVSPPTPPPQPPPPHYYSNPQPFLICQNHVDGRCLGRLVRSPPAIVSHKDGKQTELAGGGGRLRPIPSHRRKSADNGQPTNQRSAAVATISRSLAAIYSDDTRRAEQELIKLAPLALGSQILSSASKTNQWSYTSYNESSH